MSQPIRTVGKILKSVPSGLFKSQHDLYGYLSVEVKDRDGDIIRVAGIETPESMPLVGTAHRYSSLPDGTYPQVGSITEFARTSCVVKGKTVPALAFGADYIPDDPYAAKFKARYESGHMDAFSGGFEPSEDGVRELPGGRYDVLKSRVFEASCCLVPSNPYTTVLKSLRETFGDDFDPFQYLDERMSQLFKAVEEMRPAAVPADADTFVWTHPETGKQYIPVDGHNKIVDDLTKAFNKRFDQFESDYVARSEDAEQNADRQSPPEPKLDITQLRKSFEDVLAKLPTPSTK